MPSDLDILRPFSSTTKPWVSRPRYGAWPSMAAPVSKEEWNQPRCWSEPSRYRSARGPWSWPIGCEPRITCQWVVPESNQTSRVSLILSYWAASSPSSSAASSLNQASMPCCSTRRATCSISSTVRGCSSPLSLCRKNGIGTPQLRWREMHQSGRLAIMPCRRAWPQPGTNSVRSMAASARSRRLAPAAGCLSMPTNHCAVAR
ncbi:hypothetical protein D3C86_1532930 [compost metagenome]